jgi:hypothetical protein
LLSSFAFKLCFQALLSSFAFKLCFQALLSNFAFKLCFQALLSSFAFKIGFQAWLSSFAFKSNLRRYNMVFERRRPALTDSFAQSMVLAPLFVWMEVRPATHCLPGHGLPFNSRSEDSNCVG